MKKIVVISISAAICLTALCAGAMNLPADKTYAAAQQENKLEKPEKTAAYTQENVDAGEKVEMPKKEAVIEENHQKSPQNDTVKQDHKAALKSDNTKSQHDDAGKSDSKATPVVEPEKPSHTHRWVAVYSERQVEKTKQVAWTKCYACGADMTGNISHIDQHLLNHESNVHYGTEYRTETYYETESYISGYKCSCGKTK